MPFTVRGYSIVFLACPCQFVLSTEHQTYRTRNHLPSIVYLFTCVTRSSREIVAVFLLVFTSCPLSLSLLFRQAYGSNMSQSPKVVPSPKSRSNGTSNADIPTAFAASSELNLGKRKECDPCLQEGRGYHFRPRKDDAWDLVTNGLPISTTIEAGSLVDTPHGIGLVFEDNKDGTFKVDLGVSIGCGGAIKVSEESKHGGNLQDLVTVQRKDIVAEIARSKKTAAVEQFYRKHKTAFSDLNKHVTKHELQQKLLEAGDIAAQSSKEVTAQIVAGTCDEIVESVLLKGEELHHLSLEIEKMVTYPDVLTASGSGRVYVTNKRLIVIAYLKTLQPELDRVKHTWRGVGPRVRPSGDKNTWAYDVKFAARSNINIQFVHLRDIVSGGVESQTTVASSVNVSPSTTCCKRFWSACFCCCCLRKEWVVNPYTKMSATAERILRLVSVVQPWHSLYLVDRPTYAYIDFDVDPGTSVSEVVEFLAVLQDSCELMQMSATDAEHKLVERYRKDSWNISDGVFPERYDPSAMEHGALAALKQCLKRTAVKPVKKSSTSNMKR